MKSAWEKRPPFTLAVSPAGDGTKFQREPKPSLQHENRHDVTRPVSRLLDSDVLRSRRNNRPSVSNSKNMKILSSSRPTLSLTQTKNPQILLNNDQFPPLSTNPSGKQHPSVRLNVWHEQTSNVKANKILPNETISQSVESIQSSFVSPSKKSTEQKPPPKQQYSKSQNTVSIHYTSSKQAASDKKNSHGKVNTQYNNHTRQKSKASTIYPIASNRPAQTKSDNFTPYANHHHHIENMLHIPQGITSISRGKQKVRTKKTLSALKKAILKERLQQYRASCGTAESQNDDEMIKVSSKNEMAIDVSSIVCLKDFVTADEVQEDDEHEEIVADLEALAKKVGKIHKVIIPRSGHLTGFAFVYFEKNDDALAAHACWNNMVLGGNELSTILIPNAVFEKTSPTQDSHESILLQLSKEILLSFHVDSSNGSCSYNNVFKDGLNHSHGTNQNATIHLDHILTEEDFEDEESLMESKNDILTLSKKYGQVVSIDIVMDADLKGRVSITFESIEHAKTAASHFNGMVIGGQSVVATLSSTHSHVPVPKLILKNVLTDDDFQDDDCLKETESDLMTLLSNFGKVATFEMELEGERKGDVTITYQDMNSTSIALKDLDGKLFGGAVLKAILSEDAGSISDAATSSSQIEHESVLLPANEPMITSGGKVIPAQYAEMKRIPKIPNKGVPRAYAKQMDNDQVIPLVIEMLGELMRLQLRAKETNNTKVKRRLVLGLREVCRGIKSHKVKMVVLANNLDEYGALEEKLQEILDLANANEVPVISVLNKKKIGKAVGKSIKVSVVGIENPEGAFESFKKLKKMCDK